MMTKKKLLHATSQYKRDFKKYLNQPKKLAALRVVLDFLANGERVPDDYFPHRLHHDYKGCWECHIEDDFLLIWIGKDVIDLVRLGSHAELYGKGRKR